MNLIWYDDFETELYEIYKTLNNYYPNVVLTGSAAIAFVLKHLEMNEELVNFKPNDLDFYYVSKLRNTNVYCVETKFGDYNIKPNQINESSVTFESSNTHSDNFVKSFDISKINNLNKFNLNGIDIINLKSLRSGYLPDLFTDEDRIEKDNYKIKLIDKIIDKVISDGKLHEFGLDDYVTTRKKNLFSIDDIGKNKLLFTEDCDN